MAAEENDASLIAALAHVCVGMLRLKYELVASEELLGLTFRTLCPSWRSMSEADVVEAWNFHLPPVDDKVHGHSCRVRLDLAEVDFQQAQDTLTSFRGTSAACVKVVRPTREGSLYAAAFDTLGDDLVAIDGREASLPHLYFGKAKFLAGWTLTPEVVMTERGGETCSSPIVTRLYSSKQRERDGRLWMQALHDKGPAAPTGANVGLDAPSADLAGQSGELTEQRAEPGGFSVGLAGLSSDMDLGANEVQRKLFPGEAEGPPGFARRASTDSLRRWIPLRQLPLVREWLPPAPPSLELTAEGRERVLRPVLCVGPPSVRAVDWAEEDTHGSCGTAVMGNALAQLALRSSDELLIVEIPHDGRTMGLGEVAGELAPLLVGRLEKGWAAVGVSVGAWVISVLLGELAKLGPQGAEAVRQCERLHVVGFPPPNHGVDFDRPEGLDDEDWSFATTLDIKDSKCTAFPQELSVYHFHLDDAIAQDHIFEWFRLDPALQNVLGPTRSPYNFFDVQGDHGILRSPKHRTDLYWALSNRSWGVGPQPRDLTARVDPDKAFKAALVRLGHGPRRPHGLFHTGDAVLAQLDADPSLVPFSNVSGRPYMWHLTQHFCAGDVGAALGMDVRLYMDEGSAPRSGNSKTGCRTISAVRFGNSACLSVFPGSAGGVHGGAVATVQDELAACCAMAWVGQGCAFTRKTTHQLSRAVVPFQTYRVECVIESVKHCGALYTIKAMMTDLQGTATCISHSELVDAVKMMMLQSDSGKA